jgi:1,4-dihydroxy-2-naphthoate octaprenyltransferase
VGKRNLVVRVGRERAVWLYLGLAAAGVGVVPIGVIRGAFPPTTLAALMALPLLVTSGRHAVRTYRTPRAFVPAIRRIVACYALAVALFTAAIALEAVWAAP